MRALATFVTLLGSVAVFGQTRDTAAIFGGVSDSQGAAIPGASVTLTSTATGQVRKIITDESGSICSLLYQSGPIPLLSSSRPLNAISAPALSSRLTKM